MTDLAPKARIDATVQAVRPVDGALDAQIQSHLDRLTKPPGSLGRLEEVALTLGRIQRTVKPEVPRKTVLVFAGDHGVAAEGVSAFPPDVTPQMVGNFAAGGAAVNVLARQAGASVVVTDVGVNCDFDPYPPGVVGLKVRKGTGSIIKGPAMTRAEAEAAIAAGIEVAEAAIADGVSLIATGDMGIGNTTPSAAITSVMTGQPPSAVTGRGTGVDDEALARKVAAVEAAIQRNAPDPADPVGVLAAVGGLEIGAIAGAVLGASRHRVAVLVDGYISTAGALIAHALCPAVSGYMLAGHRSAEPGHRLALAHLGLCPLIQLDMRLGEGSGAVLAMHVAEAACRITSEMATFDSAGVSERADP